MYKILLGINTVAFIIAFTWCFQTRDFEPAITTFTLLATLIGIFTKIRSKHKRSVNREVVGNSSEKIKQEEGGLNKEEAQSSHIVDYVINFDFDSQVTDEELNILSRFAEFPRGAHTQGYRLDWIYNDLLKDIPQSTTHIILENLLDKGFLEKWITKRGSTYYRLSDNGRRFLVEKRLIRIK